MKETFLKNGPKFMLRNGQTGHTWHLLVDHSYHVHVDEENKELQSSW